MAEKPCVDITYLRLMKKLLTSRPFHLSYPCFAYPRFKLCSILHAIPVFPLTRRYCSPKCHRNYMGLVDNLNDNCRYLANQPKPVMSRARTLVL
jgi:hypothetical protein